MLLRLTYMDDLNFNGDMTIQHAAGDALVFAANVGTGTTWALGDITHDGISGPSDALLFAANYATGLPSLDGTTRQPRGLWRRHDLPSSGAPEHTVGRSRRGGILSAGSVPWLGPLGAAMNRLHQLVLIAATLVASWLAMQAMHEAGHILGAYATGGRVAKVVLYPLAISRTDVRPDPRPLVVAWAGPICGGFGALLAFWAPPPRQQWRGAFVLRFFAGFALVANGLYIGVGSFGGVGDCGEMLRHGSALCQLWLFGAVAAPAGLWLWHGLGRYFGLGRDARPIDSSVCYFTLAVCLAIVILEFAFGSPCR